MHLSSNNWATKTSLSKSYEIEFVQRKLNNYCANYVIAVIFRGCENYSLIIVGAGLMHAGLMSFEWLRQPKSTKIWTNKQSNTNIAYDHMSWHRKEKLPFFYFAVRVQFLAGIFLPSLHFNSFLIGNKWKFPKNCISSISTRRNRWKKRQQNRISSW